MLNESVDLSELRLQAAYILLSSAATDTCLSRTKKKKNTILFQPFGDKRMKENLSGRIHFLVQASGAELEKALKTQPGIKSVSKGTGPPPVET